MKRIKQLMEDHKKCWYLRKEHQIKWCIECEHNDIPACSFFLFPTIVYNTYPYRSPDRFVFQVYFLHWYIGIGKFVYKNCKYYKPQMNRLLSYCKRLYKLPGCAAGGCLHILLDDNNYDDESLAFCRRYCEENAAGEERKLAIKILDMYSAMSLKERTLFDNMWNGQNIECSNQTNCEFCYRLKTPEE